jgi:hypothetical protein
MIDAWLNNNDLKFILDGDKNEEVKLIDYGLKWNKHQCLVISSDLNKSRWTIIEPEPVKVSFAEAFKAYYRNANATVKSLKTGKIFNPFNQFLHHVTDEEIDSDWEVLE